MALKRRVRSYDEVVLVDRLVVVFFGAFSESYGAGPETFQTEARDDGQRLQSPLKRCAYT